jgi:hypothetical protein
MKTGIAELPLHQGKAPRWLFARMAKLSRAIIEAIVLECGTHEFLCRISDPYWFQALGSILGFDWHSSGVTTTVCGAMKEGTKDIAHDLGIYFCGGKGGRSRTTPQEISSHAEHISVDPAPLIYSSKIAAKVDNTCVQDGYTLYHHMFVFTKSGQWSVIQQGMNPLNRKARRYHWLSTQVNSYVCEPHTAVCCDTRHAALNMVARESEASRNIVTTLAQEHPERLFKETQKFLKMPSRHPVLRFDINPKYFHKVLLTTYERSPQDFETLVSIRGVGPKTVRALALIGELLFGTAPSFRDPARYSFAHGGKDGFPYPVNRKTYEHSISYLERAVKNANIGRDAKLQALKKLSTL